MSGAPEPPPIGAPPGGMGTRAYLSLQESASIAFPQCLCGLVGLRLRFHIRKMPHGILGPRRPTVHRANPASSQERGRRCGPKQNQHGLGW